MTPIAFLLTFIPEPLHNTYSMVLAVILYILTEDMLSKVREGVLQWLKRL